jgi:hypothetical protein
VLFTCRRDDIEVDDGGADEKHVVFGPGGNRIAVLLELLGEGLSKLLGERLLDPVDVVRANAGVVQPPVLLERHIAVEQTHAAVLAEPLFFSYRVNTFQTGSAPTP